MGGRLEGAVVMLPRWVPMVTDWEYAAVTTAFGAPRIWRPDTVLAMVAAFLQVHARTCSCTCMNKIAWLLNASLVGTCLREGGRGTGGNVMCDVPHSISCTHDNVVLLGLHLLLLGVSSSHHQIRPRSCK